MYKAYKFRIYPIPDQQWALAEAFEGCHWYWNSALKLCQKAYKNTLKWLSIKVIEANFKKEYFGLKPDIYCQRLVGVTVNLSKIYQKIFEKKANLSRCKSKKRGKAIAYTQNSPCAEDSLPIKGMANNHTLDRVISNCGWGMFFTRLKYKADRESKIYWKVDKFFPCDRFATCSLDSKTWTYGHSHAQQDCDINAAVNHQKQALRILSLRTSDTANLRGCQLTGKASVLPDAIPVEVGNPRCTCSCQRWVVDSMKIQL